MLFGSRRSGTPILPIGLRIYAIGDVHGEAALLLTLLRLIRVDNDAREPGQVLLVLLGDLIDRGPDGALLVQLFSRLEDERVIVLKGNHEAGLVATYEGDESALGGWLSFGGAETLAGFGIRVNDVATPAALVEAMRARIDTDVVDWLGALPTHWQCGDYFFVHAGVRPRVRLDRQNADDLLWIREPFLSSQQDHGKVIVHGHSIEPGVPRLGANRIGIDTGGHEHGTLTALALEGNRQWLLQAGRDDVAQPATSPQPTLAGSAAITLAEEIAALIGLIVREGSHSPRAVAPLLELTPRLLSKRPLLARMRARLGTRGHAAAAFAVALCGLGAAATYFRPPTVDHHPAAAVIAVLPTVTPPPRPAPAVSVEATKPHPTVRRIHRMSGKGKLIARRHDTEKPQAPRPPDDQLAPRLYGSELQAALAEDRAITRRLNDGELARLRAERVRD